MLHDGTQTGQEPSRSWPHEREPARKTGPVRSHNVRWRVAEANGDAAKLRVAKRGRGAKQTLGANIVEQLTKQQRKTKRK